MTHAGFWVDGAVRQPEARHGGNLGTVVAKSKDGTDIGSYVIGSLWVNWQALYWLDATPRESLTPEELFSVVKVLWPRCDRVLSPTGATVGWQIEFDDTNEHTNIDWGNLTQYPPPVEPQWIRITRENVGQYLFRECRTQKNDITYAGRIVGWCIEDDCCLVESDYQTEEPILQWDCVEVQA